MNLIMIYSLTEQHDEADAYGDVPHADDGDTLGKFHNVSLSDDGYSLRYYRFELALNAA